MLFFSVYSIIDDHIFYSFFFRFCVVESERAAFLFCILDFHCVRLELQLQSMDRPVSDDITPLISKSGIPTAVRDIRETHEKQLAVYLILASTVFERIAFYVLAANLALTADPQECPSSAGPIAILIFTGK